MTRPRRTTVDYFPHYTTSGKTLYTLERKYQNDGYAFWYKLLELLGASEGQYIDYNDEPVREYLAARADCRPEKALEILNLLASLGAIDTELWRENKIIYSQKFVNNLSIVYARRNTNPPAKEDIIQQIAQSAGIIHTETPLSGVNVRIYPQSRVEESRVKESRGEESTNAHDGAEADQVRYSEIVKVYNANFGKTFGVVTIISEKRKKSLKILAREIGADNIAGVFDKAQASDFLRGINNRAWKATFDWIINATNAAKIISGNYDNKTASAETNSESNFVKEW